MDKTLNTFLKPLNISNTKAGIVISPVCCFILAINVICPYRWLEETNLDTIINFAVCVAIIACNFDEIISASGKRSLKGINDDSSFSSGRILIRKTFMDEIGLSGHATGVLDVNVVKNYNAYLQISYSFGLVTGLVYLLLTLYYGVIILKNFISCVKNKIFENEFIFSAIVLIGYIISGMLSAAVSPYLYYFVFMMNICIVPYIGQNYIYKFKEGTNGL